MTQKLGRNCKESQQNGKMRSKNKACGALYVTYLRGERGNKTTFHLYSFISYGGYRKHCMKHYKFT